MNLKTNRIKELVALLNTYRDAYYNRNESLVSDKEYDMLYDELVKLEREQGLIIANSPTQTVGYTSLSQLQKVKHSHPLLSLGKTTDIDEFIKYFGNKDCLIMAKLDGLTCSLAYDKGKLVRAESRGDGEIGEDITHNAKVFFNLPTEISFNGKLEIDGECVITYDEFKRIKDREGTEYKNPRNLVSGSVRQLNSEIAAKRNIKFIAWRLHEAEDISIQHHSEGFEFLSSLGFEIVPYYINSFNAIEWIKEECKNKQIPIDGIVGMFDDIKYGNTLGSTGHHPKHSLAYKFYQEENETTLKDIEWSTSRTGLVNPVAIFDAVEIDGTTVSRASLNNVSIIKELQLGIGDTITVIKANQIIPYVTQNLTRSNTYQIPLVCPDCGHPTIIKNDNGREMLYCTNKYCTAIFHDRIANFVSRDGMNIVGLSDKRLDTLMSLGYISDFESIYNLENYRNEIAEIDGFGKSSVDNLLSAISKSKNCSLQNIIVAIGIPNVGKSTAKTIAKFCLEKEGKNAFETLLELAKNNYDWSILSDVGRTMSDGINQYINENIDQIEPMLHILNIEQPVKSGSATLAGKTFCITGKLVSFHNRDALVADIESNGGSVVSSVTAKTNYLITNDKTSGSSKNKAAEKHGTKIITEIEYINGNL